MTAVYFERRGQIYAITLSAYDPMAVETLKAVVPAANVSKRTPNAA